MLRKICPKAGGAGAFDFAANMDALGIAPSMLENLDIDAAKVLIEEKGLDLSMLEQRGLDVDKLIAEFKGVPYYTGVFDENASR
ncbi:MAG: hypothetical protein AAFN63_18115 [Pseudomonadota bacterium]